MSGITKGIVFMPTALKVQFITAIRLWKTPWTFEDEEEEEEFSREIIRDTTARLKILTFNLTVENLRLMVKVVNFAMLGSQGSSLPQLTVSFFESALPFVTSVLLLTRVLTDETFGKVLGWLSRVAHLNCVAMVFCDFRAVDSLALFVVCMVCRTFVFTSLYEVLFWCIAQPIMLLPCLHSGPFIPGLVVLIPCSFVVAWIIHIIRRRRWSDVRPARHSGAISRASSQDPDLPGEAMCEDRYFTNKEWAALEQQVAEEAEIERAQVSALEAGEIEVKSGKFLGEGTYGIVQVASIVATGQQVALKTTKSAHEWPQQTLAREIHILKHVRHPNIVAFRGIARVDERRQGFLMTLCDQGSIADLLALVGALDETSAVIFLRDLLGATAYLHRHSFIHRDIKPANCLIANRRVLLGDFGATTRYDLSAISERRTLQGTALYMAPEVAQRQELSRKCDIWSLGCCALEMLTLELPCGLHTVSDSADALARLRACRSDPECPSSTAPKLSEHAASFVALCLRFDPAKRANSVALLSHKLLLGDTPLDFPAAVTDLLESASKSHTERTAMARQAPSPWARQPLQPLYQLWAWLGEVEQPLDMVRLEKAFRVYSRRRRFELLLAISRFSSSIPVVPVYLAAGILNHVDQGQHLKALWPLLLLLAWVFWYYASVMASEKHYDRLRGIAVLVHRGSHVAAAFTEIEASVAGAGKIKAVNMESFIRSSHQDTHHLVFSVFTCCVGCIIHHLLGLSFREGLVSFLALGTVKSAMLVKRLCVKHDQLALALWGLLARRARGGAAEAGGSRAPEVCEAGACEPAAPAWMLSERESHVPGAQVGELMSDVDDLLSSIMLLFGVYLIGCFILLELAKDDRHYFRERFRRSGAARVMGVL